MAVRDGSSFPNQGRAFINKQEESATAGMSQTTNTTGRQAQQIRVQTGGNI